MSVVHVWAGAATDTSVRVRGKVTGSSTRVAVDTSPGFSAPSYTGPEIPTADGIVSFTVTGLTAGTRYYYALEDDSVLDTAAAGEFRTHPVPVGERASYIIGAAGDAGLTGAAGDDSFITDDVSDNPVFDTMRSQCAAEGWLWFSHLGDLHYRDIGSATASLYRDAYDDTLTFNGAGITARQGRLYRSTAVTYVWDDHDFGPNNSDRTAAGNATANSVYRERVPHYTLPGGASGIHQAWQVGRVLYVISDCRSFRDPNADPQSPAKTMLGTGQKAWLETLLATARDSSGAEALVWQSSSRWIGGTDTWSSFRHERDELVQLFGDTGWLDRMIMLTADEHALGISSGPNNPYGAFPMYMLASMDSDYTTATDDASPIYNLARKGGRQQYGTLRVTDSGHTIALTGTGYRAGTALMAHTAYLHAGNPVWALDGTTAGKGDIVPPFRPLLDDQGVRNEITAKREDGGEYTYADTGHIAAKGRREADLTVNVATDAQLPGQASWRVRLGTEPGMRYPSVSPALNVRPELAGQWLATELGDAGTVTGLPPQHPPDPVHLIAEGYTETIQPHRWDITANTAPAGPYTVLQLPADVASAGPDGPNRLETSGAQLTDAVDADDTELLIHTPPDGIFDHAPWIISAGLADAPHLKPTHFPFDLELGGEKVRATAITPYGYDAFTRVVGAGSWGSADSGQAWTLVGGAASERSVDGARGLVTLPSAPSTLRFQMLPGDVGDCEIRVRLSVSQVATGASLVPGILLRYTSGSNWYRARIHFGVSGSMFVSITRDTTQIGGSIPLPHTYTANQEFEMRVRIIGHRILQRVWRTGTIEPQIWHNDQTVTTSPVAAGQIGTTASAFAGNTNASPVCRFDQFDVITPQRATVTRSVNTVTKPHTAGTPIALARPAGPGL